MQGNVLFKGRGRLFINGTSIVGRYNDSNKFEAGVIDKTGAFLLEYTDEIWVPLESPCRTKDLLTINSTCSKASLHPVYKGVFPALSPKTNGYGLYSVKGNWIVEPDKVQLIYVEDGVYRYVNQDKTTGFVDETGKEIDYTGEQE